MSKLRIQLDELKAALAEIEGRTNDLKVTIEFSERQIRISATDRTDNIVEAVLYEDGNLGAQFRCTERLMYMKDKKKI